MKTGKLTCILPDNCRWRQDQINMRASHVASSLRTRPASVDELTQKIERDHGT